MEKIGIDPGEPGGGATFARSSGGLLIACGKWKPEVALSPADLAIVETQVIIPRFTKKPASIITLAQRTGAILACFGWPEDESMVRLVLPRSWKGGTKKPKTAKAWASYVIHRLIEKALTPAELSIYLEALEEFPDGGRHNLADGVGILLWEEGRLK